MIRLKRAYEPASASDGERILIDRLWPRGLTKAAVAADEWMKELAPSTELRRWFDHDPARWAEFQRRYRRELRAQSAALDHLARRALRRRVTLVFGAKDEARNDAVVLAAVLRRRMAALGASSSKASKTKVSKAKASKAKASKAKASNAKASNAKASKASKSAGAR